MTTYFIISVVLLATLLFFPVTHLIWVLSVRRLERKLKRTLSDVERQAQKQRARFIAVFAVIIFSFLFNISTLGIPNA